MAIDQLNLNAALLEAEKEGIQRDKVVEALSDAIIRAYRKYLGGNDADVRVNIDVEKGTLSVYHVKKIVDDVQDDFLELSLEDAKALEKEKKGKIENDEFFVSPNISEIKKSIAMSIRTIFKQKYAEAGNDVLYEQFKDKIGTMVTGKVENCGENGVSVSIGNTSTFLPKSQMIGNEKYKNGDLIRLFISDVNNGNKGSRILVSRASEGFLNALFFEEIREIYDGTIIIKAIARAAGERSKVAVYSTLPDVDPAGACIGSNGLRIQKIVSQLGNEKEQEKIDIIVWSENVPLFVMESLKPAKVCGIVYKEGKKEALVIVKDDSLSLAIGKQGINVKLAVKLTKCKIDIKTESQAIAENISYQTFEEIQAIEIKNKEKEKVEARLSQIKMAIPEKEEVLPGLPEGYVSPMQRHYEEENNEEVNEALERESENIPENDIILEATAPVKEEKVEEKVDSTITVEETSNTVVPEKKAVKTTTTLSDLEKKLEQEAAKDKKTTNKKYNKKKKTEEDKADEPTIKENIDHSKYMSIYTEEELREIEEQEKKDSGDFNDDEDVDYDEYEDYYEDDK